MFSTRFRTSTPFVTTLLRRRRMSLVPFVPVRINEQRIQMEAEDVLRVVRPQWLPYNVKCTVFTDGLSNKLVGFFTEENKEDIVIVKVFGSNTDMMVDRKAEIETMRLLHQRKCGAEVYATFSNGICYQFINGITLEVDHCQNPLIYPLVAAEMARMHSDICGTHKDQSQSQRLQRNASHDENSQVYESECDNPVGENEKFCADNNNNYRKSQIWNKLRQFGELGENIMAQDLDVRYRLEQVGVISGWALDAINELESILESHNMPVTFCHNDLIPRNIVYNEKTGKITFIDVEYAMYNYPAFDVANHFLEFAGINHIDYSKCPDIHFRHKWIKEYLHNLQLNKYKEEITVQKFDFWIQLCFPVSHLIWGLWGICQAKHSTINFDYVGYVGLRFAEFEKHMKILRRDTLGYKLV